MGALKTIGLAQANMGSALTASTQYLVEDNSGNIYYFYNQPYTGFIEYLKSTDGGISWSRPVIVSGTKVVSYLTIWYDRWSGINGGLIHVAYLDIGGHDLCYKNINTESADALSSETIIFNGVSTDFDGTVSITRTRGGNLLCCGCIDQGVESFSKKSTDIGATWATIASPYEATKDRLILMPGWATDNQDGICFYYDNSATEISRKLYDDSANTWSETSIATGITFPLPTAYSPSMAATVDIVNASNVLTVWTNYDFSTAKLRCWKVTEAAITEVANIIPSSLGKQGLCGISIDTDTQYWYAFYGGKSDGSGTWNTSVLLCYKISKDQGVTWENEIVLPTYTNAFARIFVAPRFRNNFKTTYSLAIGAYLITYFYASIDTPRANYILGI